MPADYSRSRRVGELIQRELATLLTREIKDPRLSLISITAVDVTRDMGLAKVFYTIINIDKDNDTVIEHKKQVKQALKKASGFLRYELGQRIKLRVVPTLDFRYDVSIEKGIHLSQLIDNAVSDDHKRSDSEDNH
ncbi:MAG: 30S ribosome-binding factor RbfA [Gammaproteobacteria bacterium]|nr:30S ribosome-binding factor RbfA [Gammaproteobacteria bacterium]